MGASPIAGRKKRAGGSVASNRLRFLGFADAESAKPRKTLSKSVFAPSKFLFKKESGCGKPP